MSWVFGTHGAGWNTPCHGVFGTHVMGCLAPIRTPVLCVGVFSMYYLSQRNLPP
jgi:hypothetical protein